MSYKIYSISLKRADTSVTREQRYAGVVQWQNTSLPSWIRGFDSHHPLCGAETPHFLNTMSLQLSWIEQRPSKPWVGGSNPFRLVYGGYSAVGQRARLWLWRPRVRVPVSTRYREVLLMGYRQAVRHRTLTPALRWFESNQPSWSSHRSCAKACS